MSTHPISVLVLDDDADRHAAFTANNPDCVIHSVYTCQDALAAVYDNHYDLICFDHDLGWNDNTNSYETSVPFARIVRSLIDDGAILDTTSILVHSSNPVGAQDILSFFSRTMNHTYKIPFAWVHRGLLNTISGNCNE